MKRLVLMAAIILASLAVTLHAQDPADRMTVNWSDPSRPGLVKVQLMNGAITVRSHTGRDVIIEGRAVGRRTPEVRDGLRRIDSAGTGLIIEEASNVLTISSRSWSGGGNLDIQVPARTNLSLGAINGGAITVEGVEGEIEVTNTNGNVRLTNVAGSVVAHATNGNVIAVLRSVSSDKPLSFTSMNNNVDVTLPAATKATLKISSDNGGVYSNFDIREVPGTGGPTVDDTRNTAGQPPRPPTPPQTPGARGRPARLRIETPRTTTYTINGGGPDVEIRTLNGNVFLRRGQ